MQYRSWISDGSCGAAILLQIVYLRQYIFLFLKYNEDLLLKVTKSNNQNMGLLLNYSLYLLFAHLFD